MKNACLVIVAVLGMIVFTACPSETEDFNIDFGYEYYPMEINEYWNYKVDSIIYIKLEDRIDTTSSFIREEIVETFVDAIGDTIHRIERYTNQEYDEDWFVSDEWSSHVDETKVTRTEENLKYIKMVFPAEEGERWDGNTFIDEELEINVGGENLLLFLDWDYKVLSLNETETIGGIEYQNVMTIQNADNFNPNLDPSEQDKLHRRFVIEKYAKGVGLVYKKHMILNSQCTTQECETIPWEEKAEEGYIMELTLIEHGK